MIKKALLISLPFLLGACSSLSVQEQRSLLVNSPADDVVQFKPLPTGNTGGIDLEDKVIEIKSGRSFYQAYALEPGHPAFYVQLRTYIERTSEGDGFFYPVIDLLDANKKRLKQIKPQLRFTQQGTEGRYAAVPLHLTRDVAFVVIRTDPKLYEQEASYTTKHEGASWSYSVSPFDKRYPAKYLPLGNVELLTPDTGYNVPFEKLSGPYWQVAIAQGGSKLASTDDFLPDLTLAGGPSFSLGYAWAVPSRPFSTIRTQMGYSYYTAQGESGADYTQKYMTADALWVESNQVSSIGFGLTHTNLHTWETGDGEISYDPSTGAKLILEIRGSMGVTIGAQLSWMDFTDENGDSQRSNAWGIYFNSFF